MGWQPEKVNKGGLRNAVQSLSVSASPQHPVRRSVRKRRSAQRHQRAGRSLRARHGGDRGRPGQRRAALPRSASPAASTIICSSRFSPDMLRDALRAGADGAHRAQASRRRRPTGRIARPPSSARAAASAPRRWRPRSPGCSATKHEPLDRAARSRRAFRHRRARARSRAGPRPDRRDRESRAASTGCSSNAR